MTTFATKHYLRDPVLRDLDRELNAAYLVDTRSHIAALPTSTYIQPIYPTQTRLHVPQPTMHEGSPTHPPTPFNPSSATHTPFTPPPPPPCSHISNVPTDQSGNPVTRSRSLTPTHPSRPRAHIHLTVTHTRPLSRHPLQQVPLHTLHSPLAPSQSAPRSRSLQCHLRRGKRYESRRAC